MRSVLGPGPFGLLGLLVFCCPFLLPAAPAPEVARLYSSQGQIEKRLSAAAPWDAAPVGTLFEQATACRTFPNSRAAVLFVDGVLVRLRETTLMEFNAGSKSLPIRMISGAAYFFSREPRRFPQIDTPLVSAAVNGTEFVVEVQPNQTIITVLEGDLVCFNPLGQINVGPGEQAITVAGAAPVKQILVRPWDAVQWALYYPAVLDAAELGALGFPDAASALAVQQSVAAYKAGDLAAAFAALDQVPDPKPVAVALFLSALHLSVGQVQQSDALLTGLEPAIVAAPARSQAGFTAISRSHRAIVAVVNNDREDALALAGEAVAADPDSAAAALAMSYVQQARFNLPEALRWAETATRLQPQSGTVHARLAELHLGFGQTGRALRTIENGLKAAPDDSRVLTVAGFSHLTRYETDRARELFERATALDDSAGLPHLGRGLALIRQNRLEEGRRELEIAVHLEPRNSLLRSYLGKAFFEEKRDHLAATEYDLARDFDPLDPTPYLYSALHKLGNHRPVEALWDIEDSIALNDNRAVYRSRLLLDQDQAVRSVSLSQIFNQIGFAEAGRTEAVKSINRDYANFSAHLLLSGSYFDRPQLNQAVISEQLLARLLAPVNINSVRGEASFNEYSSLFDRQRLQAFLLSEARSADEFIQAAPRVTMAFNRFAAAVVYGARYQEGYRSNDDAELYAPGLLAQYQLTPADTLSVETLQFRIDEGDTAIRFDPEISDPELRRRLENFTQRVGWHHRFGPGSHLVAQGLYINRELELEDNDTVNRPGFRIGRAQEIDTEGVRGDLQQIWDTRWVSVVAGGSILDAEDRKSETTRLQPFGPPGFGILFPSAGVTPAESQRGYLYSIWHLGGRVDLTAGGSYGRVRFSEVSEPPFDSESSEVESLDPKVGLLLRVTTNTTVRAAYFETLAGAGNADLETLEPTQVAGHNQLFDDAPGTRARGAGVGLEHKFAKWTYLGAEAGWRELESPFGVDSLAFTGGTTPNQTLILPSRERSVRAYVYQVLHRTTTATLDYTLLDRRDDSSELGDLIDDRSLTHRVRLGLNYFHTFGWFTGFNATWRWQELKGWDAEDGVLDGTRDFWMLDSTLGYQFPKRTGFVAFSCNNLLDQGFLYQPVGIDQRFLPDFSVNMRLSLNF